MEKKTMCDFVTCVELSICLWTVWNNGIDVRDNSFNFDGGGRGKDLGPKTKFIHFLMKQ